MGALGVVLGEGQNPQVDQFDMVCLAPVRAQVDVLGLHVAVNRAAPMEHLQSLAELARDAERATDLKALTGPK